MHDLLIGMLAGAAGALTYVFLSAWWGGRK